MIFFYIFFYIFIRFAETVQLYRSVTDGWAYTVQ